MERYVYLLVFIIHDLINRLHCFHSFFHLLYVDFIEFLCCQDALHFGFRQTQTFHVIGKDVLRQWRRYRCLSFTTNQSDLETVEEKTVLKEF